VSCGCGSPGLDYHGCGEGSGCVVALGARWTNGGIDGGGEKLVNIVRVGAL